MNTWNKLNDAAFQLNVLCGQIEDLDGDCDVLMSNFDLYKDDLTLAIDKEKALLKEIDHKIEAAKEAMADAKTSKERYERIKASILKNMIATLESNPNIPYRDSLGKKLYLGNSERVVYDAEDELPEEFYIRKESFSVDKTKLKEALKAGREIEGASIEINKHIRGL